MSKKLNWLDKFAEEQAKKQRVASKNKIAEQIIVNPSDVPGVCEGEEVTFNDSKYKVVNTSYQDEIGEGVVLQACTNVETKEASMELGDPMSMEMGGNVSGNSCTVEPERARTNPGNVYQTSDVRDVVEPSKFNEEAQQTEQQIQQENSVDRTTVDGKYSTNRILNKMVMPTSTIEETPAVEEVSVVEEAPVAEETPVVEEAPIEEETKDCCEEDDCEHDEKKEATAMIKKADSLKIKKYVANVSDAIESEVEEVLEHAEAVVKEFVPARFVKRTLASLEKSLLEEGINCNFDKKVTREALRKTAADEVSSKEIKEFVDEIVKAIVDEIEEILSDSDDVLSELVDGFEQPTTIEGSLKGKLERKMKSMGVKCRFERKFK